MELEEIIKLLRFYAKYAGLSNGSCIVNVDMLEKALTELEELQIKYENISRELLNRTDKLSEITKENNELKEKFEKVKEFIKGE